MTAFRALLISYMTWKQNHSGTCAAAPCSTVWKPTIMALEQIGPTQAREWATTATGTGNGAGSITFPGANLNTACNGGTCTGFTLVSTGFRYKMTVTGTTTATVAQYPYENSGAYTYPLPNGTNLTFNVINFGQGSLNVVGAVDYALMYDWIFADFSSAQQQYMAASLSNYMTEMENQYAIGYYNVAYGDTANCNGAASWEGCLNEWVPAMVVYGDSGGVNTIGHLRWTLDYLFNVWLPITRQMGFDGGQQAAWSDYVVSNTNAAAWHAYFTVPWVAYASASNFPGGITGFFNDSRYSWLKNWAYSTMYELKPDGVLWKNGSTQTPVLFEESTFTAGQRWAGFDSMECLGEIYNDPTIRGWGRVITSQTVAADADGYEPSCFPWYTPDTSGNTVTNAGNDPRVNLALAKQFAGVGWFFVRTGWTENDCFFGLRYGDVFHNHPVLEAGHFEFYCRGNLLISGGSYVAGSSSAHYFLYGEESVAKNVPAITDPGDTFAQYTNGTIHYGSDNTDHCLGFSNNGGQRRTGQYYSLYGTNAVTCGQANTINQYINQAPDLAAWMRGREFYHMANLMGLVCSPNMTSPKYCWVELDLTPAYNNGLSGGASTLPGYGISNRTQRVTRLLRDIVVIPNGAGKMFVFVSDRISKVNQNFVDVERWHTINQPSIVGGVATTTRTQTAQNSANGGLCQPNYLAFNMISNGNCPGGGNGSYVYNGKLITIPSFPSGANFYNIGGSGHESDDGSGCTTIGSPCSNGVNLLQCQDTKCGGVLSFGLGSTPGEAHPDPSYGVVEAGSWRMEVTPGSAAKNDYFQTMHYGTTNGDTNTPGSVTGTTGGSGVTAFHQSQWSISNNDGAGHSCTWTVKINDLGVGGTITATGTGCVNTI